MFGYLKQIQDLCDKHGCWCIYSGDIFHKWNSPAELINFAIDRLPMGFAIPGQHDLPLHQIEDIRKSAYWTLVKAKRLFNLNAKNPIEVEKSKIRVFGFPWGVPISPPNKNIPDVINLAVVHKYIWKDQRTKYKDAPEEERASAYKDSLKGFHAAVFGDNHVGFTTRVGNCNVINCGGLYNSKSDEIAKKTMVGLLYSDGSIQPYYLDTSKDKWDHRVEAVVDENPELLDLIEMLDDMKSSAFDYRGAVTQSLNRLKVSNSVRALILDWME